MKWLFFLLITLFSLGVVFAGEELYKVYSPKEPNITYFELGQQSIVFFPPEEGNYNSISVSSSDFVVTPSSRTIPGDTSFFIQGNSPGVKNFTVTVSGESGSYSYDSSVNISSTPVEIDGPYILTDFNFLKSYSTPQSIDFFCLGSRNHPTECISETKFVFDGNEYNYVFGNKINFDFNGTKQITFYAKNTFGKESTKTFSLTINTLQEEQELQPNTSTPIVISGGGTTNHGSSPTINTNPPTEVTTTPTVETSSTSLNIINSNTVNQKNNDSTRVINSIENIFTSEVTQRVEEKTTAFSNPVSSNNILKKQFDLVFLRLENQFKGANFESNIIKGLISAIEENKHKHSIFIILVTIIILLGVVLLIPEKKVKK